MCAGVAARDCTTPWETGELGHEQSAAALIPDELAENGIGDAGHGRQHGSWCNSDAANAISGGELTHKSIVKAEL